MFKQRDTVFPRNLTAARFYFKTQLGVATIQGRLDFEGSVYRDRHAHMRIASIMSLSVCMYNAHAHMHYSWRSFTMWRDFEGSVYWDEFAETCGDISRVAGFQGAVRFRGNTVTHSNFCRLVQCWRPAARV